ncbi:hypothetical protein [Paraburkholderia aromaticivorans]|uniref:Uncharacterized protein n=1 Tax=Paraburkholderia aromaticivorans TaxID=2026199 RepID=A0A248VP04_9BURK|nr:hypothetical protein [Paraburkholderia aromaticivorans]ASW00767.1 hypothetical protein CJU94_21175 [Paraburkholderia aromaticivorans]
MHTCPWLRASIEARKVSTVCRKAPPMRASARRRPAIRASLAQWLGWRALRDVLAAIPDSNDDFGMF